ncbi:rRNA adenine methyltransferase [Pollutibacter soli]|uniref:rRNA adenine methyltransferase n=1 Tax=Pollutibacter soli TaxID=3034157 RepID=UPI003013B3A2
MDFNPENKINRLCAEGMSAEAAGDPLLARNLFQKAWDESENDFEKFVAAHYLARQQNSVEEKLKWDLVSLRFALKTGEEYVRQWLPSLYLNIGKGYEQLEDIGSAKRAYHSASSFQQFLPDDGYGRMIRSGITHAMERTYDK